MQDAKRTKETSDDVKREDDDDVCMQTQNRQAHPTLAPMTDSKNEPDGILTQKQLNNDTVEITVQVSNAMHAKIALSDVRKPSQLFTKIAETICELAKKSPANLHLNFRGYTGGGAGFLLQPLLQMTNLTRVNLTAAFPIHADHAKTLIENISITHIALPWDQADAATPTMSHFLMDTSDKLALIKKSNAELVVFQRCKTLTATWLNHFKTACILNPLLCVTCTGVPYHEPTFEEAKSRYALRLVLGEQTRKLREPPTTVTVFTTARSVTLEAEQRQAAAPQARAAS